MISNKYFHFIQKYIFYYNVESHSYILYMYHIFFLFFFFLYAIIQIEVIHTMNMLHLHSLSFLVVLK